VVLELHSIPEKFGGEMEVVTPSISGQLLQVRCLDVPNGNDADGTKLQIWTCQNNANQGWELAADNTIRWVGHNKYVLIDCLIAFSPLLPLRATENW
jgi:hypothetical protein